MRECVVVLYVVTLHGMIILVMSLRPGRLKDVLEGWVTRGRVFVAWASLVYTVKILW